MANTDDEIYFKIAADLSDLKLQFQDLSKAWDKHNADIAKGEKAYRDYGATTEKVYQKVNQKIKENMGQLVNEGKALENLEKKVVSISKKNEEAFDSKPVEDFQKTIKDLGADMGQLENLNLSVDDIDTLSQKFGAAKDDFEALNVIVDFFEQKMKGAALRSADSMEVLRKKIEETQLNIASTEKYIKDLDKQIDATAPGRVQANLIGERQSAQKALLEEKVALEDYKNQVKSAREENVSLTTQLRKVKDEMVKLELEGERGSDRWNELADEAKNYNTVLKETNAELNRTSSSTAGLDNLIGAVTGIVGIFTAAEGAAALFGGESEDLKKALIRLTGAIALLNGLQAIQTELAKKDAIATRALAFVKGQYTIATNSAATATARFGAALKLLGIGLVIGGIAALVVYWKDIAKFVGISSDKTERNNEINKKANELYSEQISELKLLIDTVKAGNLSVNEQNEAVKRFNETQGKSLGIVKDYKELNQKLIDQGDDYIAYLKKKALGEAAYQLAVQKTKEALENRANTEAGFEDYLTSFFTSGVNAVQGKDSFSVDDSVKQSNEKNAKESEDQADYYFNLSREKNKEAAVDQKKLGIVISDTNEKIGKGYEKLSGTLEALIKKQRDLKTSLITNDRDREKQLLKDQISDDKAGYEEQIKNFKGSEKEKLRVIQEFNRLYNEETGIAYEELRRNLKAIDDKYNAELEKVKLTALQAVDEVFLSDEEKQRKTIKNKFDKIRKDLFEQIDITKDAVEKEGLTFRIFTVNDAEEKETKDLNTELDTKALDRKRELAKATLEILKSNNKDILNLEKLHSLQLLEVDKAFYNGKLDIIKDNFEDIKEQDLFSGLVDELQNSKFTEDIEAVKEKLIEAFGEETAAEIIKTVEALKKVQDEVKTTEDSLKADGIGKKIEDTFSSMEGFANTLGKALGFAGEDLGAFKTAFVAVADNLYETITNLTNQAVEQQQRRVDAIDEQIDSVENEVERERELYEQGFANNYEARQQDLENLKAQKKKEEKELQKALKRRAALQKAEFLVQTAAQFGNLITASTNIFAVATTPPVGPFGIPLAIASIAAMFASFAAAKITALNALNQSSGQNFRTGLKKGKLSLEGPSHEEGGFGLYNSKSGQKVAEMESGEDILVFNRGQKRNYTHVIDAMIADSRGESNIETSIRNHYNFTKSGPATMAVVERVNTVIIKAQNAKGNASIEDQNTAREIVKLREDFNREFNGHKEERENETKTWETPEFYHVKQGNTTKKYPKK